ncbi:MAG: DUF599 domain-containing protein [Sideroxydans sp.]|nr:DUF599 domain-containing protein [Sideroxydans sp.]
MNFEFPVYAYDAISFVASVALIIAYHLYLRSKVKRDRTYTVQAVNMIARTAWVETIMREKKDILAVQTLRNSTMAATFLASTSVLMIIGILTLSEGSKMETTWHALNVVNTQSSELWLVKLICLLMDMFVAFFSFSMSIRVFNHVGYMINVPIELKHKMITPAHVVTHLNRAGKFYSIGMRAYYFIVPLVFWLFGPHFMFVSTIALLLVLYRIDRAPTIMTLDYSDVD